MVNGISINIIIDSGSTHNFLELSMAKKLGCIVSSMSPHDVVNVANGNHIACQQKCASFSWVMQVKFFTTDVMLIFLDPMIWSLVFNG